MILISEDICGVCNKHITVYYRYPIFVQALEYHELYNSGAIRSIHIPFAKRPHVRKRLRVTQSGFKLAKNQQPNLRDVMRCDCVKTRNITKITNGIVNPKKEYVMYLTK